MEKTIAEQIRCAKIEEGLCEMVSTLSLINIKSMVSAMLTATDTAMNTMPVSSDAGRYAMTEAYMTAAANAWQGVLYPA